MYFFMRIVDERVEQEKGMSSISDVLGSPTFVQTLLDLHDSFKVIVQECFSQKSLFQKSPKEAFGVSSTARSESFPSQL